MASSAELNEVKLIIKGLIASSPSLMTIRELNRDYTKEEGRQIPYQKFGFQKLLDFLQTIRDTVTVKNNYSEPSNPFISLVVSEKSEHVVSLVDRQNKSRKKGNPRRNNHAPFHNNYQYREPYRPPPYIPPPRFRPRPEPPRLLDIVMQPPSPQLNPPHNPTRNPTHNPTEQSRPRLVSSPDSNRKLPFIPLKIETQIMTLVRENPGISPQTIEQGLNDALQIDVREVYNGIHEVLKTISHKLAVKDNKVYLTPCQGNTETGNSMASYRLNPGKTQNYLPGGYGDDIRDVEFESDGFYVGGFSSDDDKPSMPTATGSMEPICESLMTEGMKSNLSLLLKKFPKGIWCWDLPELYEAEYGTPLDCREIGYISVSQMMRSVPDLFNCVLVEGTDCKVYDARTPFTQETGISRDMVAQIKELVTWHPSKGIKGIHEDKFCDKFKEVFHTEFNFKEMGFGTLHSLFEALDGEVIQFVRISNRYRICPLLDMENDDAGLLFAPYKKEDETCIKRFPSDVVSPLDTIGLVTFPEDATIGSLIEVLVAEISSPNNFWAQLRGFEHHITLYRMMDEMEVFYGNSSNIVKYTMPAEAIAVGVVCVTAYMDLPHRCRIIRVDVTGSSVRVIFLDFGTISVVERSSLRFMHKRFQELPVQAFRCTLHNLKPTQGKTKYSREVGERFLQLVIDKGLVAEIGAIDHQATTMSLILIDTTGEDDVFINDVLVEEGLAEYCVDSTNPEVETQEDQRVQMEAVSLPEEKQPCVNHAVKQEIEEMKVPKSEPEERVFTRQPAAILLNTRRKIRTPPGFGPQVPPIPNPPPQHVASSSFLPTPPNPQYPNLSNGVLYRQELSPEDAYRSDLMYLARYHSGLAPLTIHEQLTQNVTTTHMIGNQVLYGYKQQYPIAPSINPNIAVPKFLVSNRAPSECTRLDETQTRYLQHLIHNSDYSAFSVYPAVPPPNVIRYNSPLVNRGPTFTDSRPLNPDAMAYVPPPLTPLVPVQQNPSLPQFPLMYPPYNSQVPQVMPRQPLALQPSQSSFDRFFISSASQYPSLGLLNNQTVPTDTLRPKEPSATSGGDLNVVIKSEPPPSSPDASSTSANKYYRKTDSSTRARNSIPTTKSGPINGSNDCAESITESRSSVVSNSLHTDEEISVASSSALCESVLDRNDSVSRRHINSPYKSEEVVLEDDLNDIVDAIHLQDSEEDFTGVLVRFIQIEDVFLHLINVNGVLHLITDEVLGLMKFTKNVALKILKSRNTEVEFLELKQDTHSNIFCELTTNSSWQLSNKIHVVRLKHVPHMLIDLKCEARYITAIQEEIQSLPQDGI